MNNLILVENIGNLKKYYCSHCRHETVVNIGKYKDGHIKCSYCNGNIEFYEKIENIKMDNFMLQYYKNRKEKVIENLHKAGLRECKVCKIFVGMDYIKNGICVDCIK